MIGRASNRNQKIQSVFAEKSNFARKFLKWQKRAKSTLVIGIVKLYKKFHQAAMIGKASNRNQQILSVFA